MSAPERARFLILGAGCAGLSLCHALLARGVRDPILILDSKPRFEDDRTWCFWDTRPAPFTPLAAHVWHQWEVIGPDGARAAPRSRRTGYRCLRSRDFYAAVLAEIGKRPNVTLCLGTAAQSCETEGDRVTVEAGGRTYRADYVFDSRPPSSDLLAADPSGFSQRFRGRFVRADRPAFDPDVCTLMDFRVPQDRGPHFVYVLPFSPTEALVEDTYLLPAGAPPPTPEAYQDAITAYLAARWPEVAFRTEREEAGTIPMTARAFPARERRVFFIGTAGGCAKPSSGYTFARIQRQCAGLADAAAAGTLDTYQAPCGPRRARFFDAVFLQALHDRPRSFPGHFGRLFGRVPPDALARFLSETSTWRDELSVICSLPPLPFLRAARRVLASHSRSASHSRPAPDGHSASTG